MARVLLKLICPSDLNSEIDSSLDYYGINWKYSFLLKGYRSNMFSINLFWSWFGSNKIKHYCLLVIKNFHKSHLPTKSFPWSSEEKKNNKKTCINLRFIRFMTSISFLMKSSYTFFSDRTDIGFNAKTSIYDKHTVQNAVANVFRICIFSKVQDLVSVSANPL